MPDHVLRLLRRKSVRIARYGLAPGRVRLGVHLRHLHMVDIQVVPERSPASVKHGYRELVVDGHGDLPAYLVPLEGEGHRLAVLHPSAIAACPTLKCRFLSVIDAMECTFKAFTS